MIGDERVPYAVRLAAIKDFLDWAALDSKQSVEVQVRRFEELANSGAITIMDFQKPSDDNIVDNIVDAELA